LIPLATASPGTGLGKDTGAFGEISPALVGSDAVYAFGLGAGLLGAGLLGAGLLGAGLLDLTVDLAIGVPVTCLRYEMKFQ
jgi:hypothetical protein